MLIQVADQGAGIPEQDLEFVFDKFFRGVQKGMSSKGSGVGLAAVKSIVVAHRGTIRVENAPTGGAVFTVELPGNLRANR